MGMAKHEMQILRKTHARTRNCLLCEYEMIIYSRLYVLRAYNS